MYYGSMQSGGQGIWLSHVTRELARLGHDVHVISGPPFPELDSSVALHRIETHSFQAMMLDRASYFGGRDPRAHLHPLNFYEFASSRFTFASLLAGFSLRALARLTEVERESGEFDLIHDNQTLSYGVLMMRALLSRAVVATVHHPLDLDVRNGLWEVDRWGARAQRIAWYPWRMQRMVARHVDAVTFPSRASAELTRELWRLQADRVHTVYNGVDVEAFRPGAHDETEPGSLLFVGNSEDFNKGIVYALRALARIRGRAHLYVVGGPQTALRVVPAELARLGIERRVTVVGRVSEAELAQWYRRAQVLVSPSLFEGFGLPAAEAMACGTPVVATDAGALPEVVADGESGVIVPARDVEALADATERLLADPARCREMGAAGRERVLAKFTWPRTALALDELYTTVARARASR
jgi:glycosyltransferase involved in cell wall biosynthesis